MPAFTTVIQKFDNQSEKTGWTYIVIPQKIAEQLLPGNKKSFRVKGWIDNYKISHVALMPMGDNTFIMSFNAAMRKATGKRKGSQVEVKLELDTSIKQLSGDFMSCLEEEPKAHKYFQTLPPSHQQYFSNWIESAKTDATKDRRIALAVNALAQKKDFGTMIREDKARRDLLK
ncbi:MAG: YdeI/OmpD-associated family protein [Chitinophagales bacterium]